MSIRAVRAGVWLLLGSWLAAACSPPPAAADPTAVTDDDGTASTQPTDATPSPDTDPAPQAPALEDDEFDADIAALARSAESGSPDPASPQSDPLQARDIVYRVTPQGLVVEIDGFHLIPSAKPFKSKNGAYGVELTLLAKSFDGRQYRLSSPEEGPMSIAGVVESKKGGRQRFGDARRGQGETLVRDAEPLRVRQQWPGKGQPKLWWGETLTLEVGLWGLRAEDGRERPVRKLFVVKMLAANQPQAVVSPPTLDWGN